MRRAEVFFKPARDKRASSTDAGPAASPIAAPSRRKPRSILAEGTLDLEFRQRFGVVLQEFRVDEEGAEDHRLPRRLLLIRP